MKAFFISNQFIPDKKRAEVEDALRNKHGIAQTIARLFKDERALQRAIDFTGSFGTVGNVLGHSPKTTLAAWSAPELKEYPLTRSQEWDSTDRQTLKATDKASDSPLNLGIGEPPSDLSDLSKTKHSQMETVSLIREPLWRRAKWSGTAFLTTLKDEGPPTLAPIFRNGEAAKEIFLQLRKELTKYDAAGRLRIGILRGITKANPHAYRVIIGSNPLRASERPGVKYVFMLSRVQTMEPSSDDNLNRFLRSFGIFGGFFFIPAIMEKNASEPKLVWDNSIIVRQLHVRNAWQVGRNDPDAVGIHEDDDLIIPEEHSKDAPVLELLRWVRERRET